MHAYLGKEDQFSLLLEQRDSSELISKQTASGYALPKYQEDIPAWFGVQREISLFILTFHDSETNTPIGFGAAYDIVRPAGTVEAYVDVNNDDPHLIIDGLNAIADLCLKHYWFKQLYAWVPITENLLHAIKGSRWKLDVRLPDKIRVEGRWIDQGLLVLNE